MIVVRQRTQAGQDLVEEILRVDLFHDSPVDPIAHLEHPFAVHELNGFGNGRGDPRQQPPVVVVERRLRS